MKRCAFTGHRPQKLPFGFDETCEEYRAFCRELRAVLEELIAQGYGYFISGGAMGMDMIAAETVLSLKEAHPEIWLEMVSPFDAQASRWQPDYAARHARLFREADKVTRTGRVYTKDCLYRRNRYLAENADLLLAAYDGRGGGTGMTVGYAMRLGVPVRIFWPFEEEEEEEDAYDMFGV